MSQPKNKAPASTPITLHLTIDNSTPPYTATMAASQGALGHVKRISYSNTTELAAAIRDIMVTLAHLQIKPPPEIKPQPDQAQPSPATTALPGSPVETGPAGSIETSPQTPPDDEDLYADDSPTASYDDYYAQRADEHELLQLTQTPEQPLDELYTTPAGPDGGELPAPAPDPDADPSQQIALL